MQNLDNILELDECSKLNMLVIDNFYENPYAVRKFALSQDKFLNRQSPGYETQSFLSIELKNNLQKILQSFGELSFEDNTISKQNTGSFFLNTSNTPAPWIHKDKPHYSAIIFLSENAPISSGTSILKLKNTQNGCIFDKNDRIFDKTTCIEIDNIGNKFNRVLIFNSHNYHVPNNYFGINDEDGRLTQVVWFNIISNNKEVDTSLCMNNNIIEPIKSKYPCKLHSELNCDFMIIDNFYDNPLEVRNFALSQKFYITGKFTGIRSSQFLTNNIIKKIDMYLSQFGVDMGNIRKKNSNFGSFQNITCKERQCIYKDFDYDWIGIIFLNPDAPITSCLSLYEYYDKTTTIENQNKYSFDLTKWIQFDSIGNIFNRFVLFNAKYYYMLKDNFGNDINNGNLVQIFLI